MRLSFIDLDAQQRRIRPAIEEGIRRVLSHGKYILGPEVYELEEELCRFTGAGHCVSCASGTDALLMALIAWGVGPGDVVVTTVFSFMATAEVIALLGAVPVFVDIDRETYNIDTQALARTIDRVGTESGRKVKAIIAVDLFGLPADYDAIMDMAARDGILVLADAAQSFGATYKGRRVGTLAHATATSFFPAKPLGCYGDGGAVFTDDGELAERLASIRVHGRGKEKYDNVRIGLNSRLDTIQAAILLQKMTIFPDELSSRRRVAQRYQRLLCDRTDLVIPRVPGGVESAWAQYSILAADRSAIRRRLAAAGIPSAVYYPRPLHLQRALGYLGYGKGDFPVAEEVCGRILSLPMHPYLSEEDMDLIVGSL
jgi:UDP-2-acetamido-2-deoxy-ribo-hexuluronate aminotransferase